MLNLLQKKKKKLTQLLGRLVGCLCTTGGAQTAGIELYILGPFVVAELLCKITVSHIRITSLRWVLIYAN